MSTRKAVAAAVILLLLSVSLPAGGAQYQRDGRIIGAPVTYQIKDDESLYELAKEFDVGMDAIMEANPDTDPFVPAPSEEVVIPSRWILPDVPIRRGIVINVAEMRLYYFARDRGQQVTTFPVGIGDEGKDTPLGSFRVIEKIENPAWYVPESIRKEKPELPAVVPPGPDNPMGSHALRLSMRTVLIHGTNRPWGIGTRNSHGCLRMFEQDIATLFDMVPLRTRVTIVNQPVKVTTVADRVLMEVHQYEQESDLYQEALRVLAAKHLTEKVDLEKVEKAVEVRRGLLVDVTRDAMEIGPDIGQSSEYFWGNVINK